MPEIGPSRRAALKSSRSMYAHERIQARRLQPILRGSRREDYEHTRIRAKGDDLLLEPEELKVLNWKRKGAHVGDRHHRSPSCGEVDSMGVVRIHRLHGRRQVLESQALSCNFKTVPSVRTSVSSIPSEKRREDPRGKIRRNLPPNSL